MQGCEGKPVHAGISGACGDSPASYILYWQPYERRAVGKS